ncbi:MAG: glucose-1-phosphate thymidylyltransferase [Fervidicoccaceae archaeon]
MSPKALVLAAGEGSRLRPFTYSRPKHLIPLLGKPMIQYPIEDLLSSGVKDIGIVVGYFGDLIKEHFGDGSRFNARFNYIFQEKRLGIAHAIYKAIESGFLDREFIVYLGDNIIGESSRSFLDSFHMNGSDVHILLTRVRDPSQFGVAVLDGSKVKKLVEKPKEPISNLAVTGFYAFRDPDLVAKAFRDLKPSWRGEYEVTELIQWFIDRNYKVTYSEISTWWKDVGTYEGLLDAIYLLLDKEREKIEGDAKGELRGRVIVERGAVVEGKVYGPAFIGSGSYIEKSATVEPYTSIESRVRFSSGVVTRSLIMDGGEISLSRARLVESVIGANSKVRCSRELHGDMRLIISDNSYLEI